MSEEHGMWQRALLFGCSTVLYGCASRPSLEEHLKPDYLQRSQVSIMQGNWGAATADLTSAIAVAPTNATAYLQRALVYRRRAAIRQATGEPEKELEYLLEAMQDVKIAIVLDNKLPDAYATLGAIYTQLGEENNAFDMFKAAVKLLDAKIPQQSLPPHLAPLRETEIQDAYKMLLRKRAI